MPSPRTHEHPLLLDGCAFWSGERSLNGETQGCGHPCRCSCPRWQSEGGSEDPDTIVRQVHRHVAETPHHRPAPVSYTHLRAHETVLDLVCRLLLDKKKKK